MANKTEAILSADDQQAREDDWILLDAGQTEEEAQEPDEEPPKSAKSFSKSRRLDLVGSWSLHFNSIQQRVAASRDLDGKGRPAPSARRCQMTLTEADAGLIRASWGPARRDPTGAGVLLFKG